tara:strand:- start:49 stop:483 length:435 start_codon:yes stop_codon:yes gene_type:complete
MEKQIIKDAIEEAGSMYGAANSLGLTRHKFDILAKKYELWSTNQSGKGITKKKSSGFFKLEDIFEGKHPQYPTNHLKNRLYVAGIKERKCEECGIEEWNGKKIIHQLDHVNGISTDNRLENLKVLCPNCHSQTDTFCGKNKSRK